MVRLTVRVTPRAARDQVSGYHNGTVLVKLKAPPVNGAANQALVAFLAEQLSLPKASVSILRGQSARSKVVEIGGLDHDETLQRLGLEGKTEL
ncbi:MAG: DUF167 domain-containing protein [Anaerolineae bacterium]